MFSPRWLAPGANVLAGGSLAARRAALRAVARPHLTYESSSTSSTNATSTTSRSATSSYGTTSSGSAGAPRQKYVVVGSFVFKKPGDDPDAEPLVALVRRSKVNKIYTYAPLCLPPFLYPLSPISLISLPPSLSIPPSPFIP